MSSRALEKTIMGGHQMLGATVMDRQSPLASSPAPAAVDAGLNPEPVVAGSKEDLARTIVDPTLLAALRARTNGELDRTVAMQPIARAAPKRDLSHTVAMAEPLPREPRATMKMERPNLALLARTQVLEAVTAPAPAPTRAPSPIPAAGSPHALAPRAPAPGSASGIRASAPAQQAPAAFAHAYAAPAPVAPVPPHARPCSPTTDPRLIMIAEPNGDRAAGFRLLRDNLATKEKGIPRVLAVSTAKAGDGASTCAVNLAIAIAEQATHMVLLIDANFAAPALAKMLGVDETPQDGAWSAPFTLSAVMPSLHVATVARRPDGSASPIEFATLARMVAAFQRAGYQNIIIDMPSMDGSAEAPRLLQLGGGVLLAVRAGSTTSRALRKAAEQIGPQRALGVALMNAPA